MKGNRAQTLSRKDAALDADERQYRWKSREPVEGIAFLLDDLAIVADGPRRGSQAVARALRAVEPEPVYELEAADGERFVLPQSSLESPVPADIAACIAWIQKWYARQCDGDWEHSWGASIRTLDNPGWLVKINLEGTDLEGQAFPEIAKLEPERAWLSCKIVDKQFQGAGGPHMLGDILAAFVHWARHAAPM
jgi:hypothetical protein